MIISRLRDLLHQLSAQGSDALEPLDTALLEHFKLHYGCGDLLQSKLRSLQAQCAAFMATYGDGPISVLRAPARINVLGEHVDYVSYLPTASLTFGSREHEMILLYRNSGCGRVRGRSTHAAFEPFSFGLENESVVDERQPDQTWESFLFSRPAPAPHWCNYVRGAACFARSIHGSRIGTGIDFVLDSSVPPAGGASSSSALTVLALAALMEANQSPCAPHQLALDAARAEWYVGTRGGAMDHLTICLSRESNAVHISYADGKCSHVPLPGAPYCWLTFFSHAADKSREVMLEYNERAAVSRILIPALIEEWAASDPPRYQKWHQAKRALSSGSPSSLDDLERLLEDLPETITLSEMASRHGEALLACDRAFPALLQARNDRPLRLRARALHHVGEVRRVIEAHKELQNSAASPATDVDQTMRKIGRLLTASHRSLRDLYGLCTPDVEALVAAVASDPAVYGARLMGGGFGGNVLALTTADCVPGLIARVQENFYGPRGRNGQCEGSVMISTPGAGFSALTAEEAARRHVRRFNAAWQSAEQSRTSVRRLLAQLDTEQKSEVWPIIVAAGEGKRARASGLEVPKPVAKVHGMPAVVRVFRAVQRACKPSRPPIVIVSPENEAAVRDALSGEKVSLFLQAKALGTGDAVSCALQAVQGFEGRVLIVWGTQPVLSSETISLSLTLAELFPEYSMILPTALMAAPYAPVHRNGNGNVMAAEETHLEQVQAPDIGESNVGLFLLWSETMTRELEELRRQFWNEATGHYDRPGGELGFPNEMIRRLSRNPTGVFASPIADWREEKGIKTLPDVALCEAYIRELEKVEKI